MFKISNVSQLISKYQKFIISAALFLAVIGFFDKALAVGIFVLALLLIITVSASFKIGIKEKEFYLLFFIIVLLHLLGVLFIHYFNFYPFGGGEGDQFYYHRTAVDLSLRFRQGDFSIRGFDQIYPYYYVPHFYPVLVGVLYAVTVPEIIIGQILNVWIAALSILVLYLIAVEISGSKKKAFFIGLIAGFYPSYFYFGSLLIRDAIIVFISLFLLLVLLKLVKRFSWKNFFVFFLFLGFLMHFRFYIGLVAFLAFAVSLPIFTADFKKKIIAGSATFFLLAVLPLLFAGQGLFGIDFFKKFLNQETITSLREKEYQSNPQNNALSLPGSDVIVKTGFENPFKFVKNSLESFFYVSLGPFPWQIKYKRQLFSLIEMLPGYLLAVFILMGILKNLKDRNYKIIFPLIFFAAASLVVISVFVSNFGTYMRIRIPALLALLALADFTFLKSVAMSFKNRVNIILLNKIYEKLMGEKISPNVFVFLKELKYAFLGYGGAALSVFAFEVILGRALGAENYGKYVLGSIISLFLSLFTTMGVTTAALKYIAEEKDRLLQKKIITAAFSIIFFLLVFVSLVFFIFSPFISGLFSVPLDIFYPAVLMTAGFSLYTLAADVLRGLSLIKKLSFFRIAYGILIILFLVVFLLAGYISFKTAMFIISFSYFLIFLLATANIWNYISFKTDRIWLKKLLKYGVYAMIGGPLFVFLPRLGQLFVNKYLTTADVGIYHAYYFSSVNIALFFYTTFLVVFFPAASKRREKKSILEKLKKLVLFLFFAGSPLLFFTQWIILKLYGKGYPVYYSLMALFSVSGILISVYGLFGWLFYSKNISGAKLIAAITVFVLIINILLNIYLIPLFYLYGAVLAIIFSYSAGIIILFLFQKKLLE